jgi:hypothetical protein
MRRLMMGLFLAGGVAGGLLLLAHPTPASAQVSAGVVLDRDGLRHFHLALGNVYGVPVQTVTRYHPSWIEHDELPVVYLVAREARVSPDVVLALRHAGWSWIEITDHLRVDPYVFVAHLPRYGPPYGVAHGYWRKPSRSQLRRLSDRRVIEYVNVHFWSVAYHRPVTEIIVVRERYPSWTHFVRVEAPRVRFQEPPQTRTVWWNESPQASPRPAQPRAAPQAAPARGNAPAASRGQAPARAQTAPAPARGNTGGAATGGTARGAAPPAAGNGRAPAATPAPNTARGGAATPAPAQARSAPTTVPSNGRTTTGAPPAANRNQPPAASRAPAAPTTRSQPPAAARTQPPAARAPAGPASARGNAPAPARGSAPAAARGNAPAPARAPAPSAPARSQPPAASRAPASSPAPARGAAPARSSGGAAQASPPAGRGSGAARASAPGRGN